MSKPRVAKIVIEVGGAELSLSVEDAKTLQAALNELLAQPATPPIVLRQYVPTPWQPSPYWYYTSGGTSTTSPGSTVYCATNLNNSSVKLLNAGQ